jgi:hypothetical protein
VALGNNARFVSSKPKLKTSIPLLPKRLTGRHSYGIHFLTLLLSESNRRKARSLFD